MSRPNNLFIFAIPEISNYDSVSLENLQIELQAEIKRMETKKGVRTCHLYLINILVQMAFMVNWNNASCMMIKIRFKWIELGKKRFFAL